MAELYINEHGELFIRWAFCWVFSNLRIRVHVLVFLCCAGKLGVSDQYGTLDDRNKIFADQWTRSAAVLFLIVIVLHAHPLASATSCAQRATG